MLRTVLVMIHAGAGLGGLLVGLPTLSPRTVERRRVWVRGLYNACVSILLLAMVAMIALDWPGLDAGARTAFLALSCLGAVMAYRLTRAQREARVRDVGWQGRYIGHVYFTYISLWVGFVIVPALNLPAPQVAAPLAAAMTLATGHLLLARYRRSALPHAVSG